MRLVELTEEKMKRNTRKEENRVRAPVRVLFH